MNETTQQTIAHELPLNAQHIARGAAMTEIDGWLLPANFGDAVSEYQAVRDGVNAGLIDLSQRGRIEVSGAESVQFLNGMITNDVATLEEGAWMLAAFPNVQGRLVAFVRVFKFGDQRFLFDTEAATHAAVLKTLQRFTLAGDFQVTDRTIDLMCVSVQGAGANAVVDHVLGVEAASLAAYRTGAFKHQDLSFHIARATHTGEDGFDVFISASLAATFFDRLVDAGAHPCGHEAQEILRIEAGIPRYGVDIAETNVVLESGLDEAISYTKGCYIGQEIIARIHWRGHVAKQLAGVLFETDAPVQVGAQLVSVADGKEAGRITSVVLSPTLNRTIALAMIRYAYLAPGTELQLFTEGEAAPHLARIVELPFVRGTWSATHEETTQEVAP